MNISDLGVWLGDISLREVNHYTKKPMRAQEKTLSKIIKRNKNSYYGKKYDFKNIKSIDDFREKLPLTTYADYEEFVDRMIENKENNLMYSGKNIRYCSSSGSVGKPKILPKSVKDLWNMQCFGFSCSVATAAHYLKDVKGIKMPSQMGPLVLQPLASPDPAMLIKRLLVWGLPWWSSD